MSAKHRYGLAGSLILSLVLAPNTNAQDAIAGRELFEREWEFVDRALTFTQLNSTRLPPQRRDRGHGRAMGRGPRPDHHDHGREWTSIRRGDQQNFAADGAGFPADGLGPMHNAVSCAACHPGGGGSGVDHNVTLISVDPRSPFFDQPADRGGRGTPGTSVLDFFPGLVSGNTLSVHTVVHDLSTRPGYQTIRQRLSDGVPNGLAPEWFNPQARTVDAIARQPVVSGRYGAFDYSLSQRNSPPLHGMGQIERISVNRLKAISLAQPRLSAGTISGRVAGKYGWRGQVNTLSDFVAGACATELGLNVAGTAQQADDPADPRYLSLAADVTTMQIAELTSYIADLPAPTKQLRSPEERKRVRRGEQLFGSVGCATCHIEDLPPARGIFSDLLLHDMGPDLQDPFPAPANQQLNTNSAAMASPYPNRSGRGEASPYRPGGPPNRRRSGPRGVRSFGPTRTPQAMAMNYSGQPQYSRADADPTNQLGQQRFASETLQREWKTPPLWGVADSAPYLHDGRAETLTDAIQWHGGEADESKRKFFKLDEDQQASLIAFLESLKAPSD